MNIVSLQPEKIVSRCDKAVVLRDGHLHCFGNVDEAYSYYMASAS